MTLATRATVRAALAEVLTNRATGSGQLLQAVYGYAAQDFEGQTPVVCVTSSGTKRERLTGVGWKQTYYIDLLIFVLCADQNATDYTAADADNSIDAVEAMIAELANEYAGTKEVWKRLNYGTRSFIAPVVVGGEQYWMETIPLELEVY